MTVAVSPTSSEIRLPQMIRVRIGRPLKSVPSQYCDDGGWIGFPGASVTDRPAGSASSGAQIATRMMKIISARPIMPSRSCRNSRQNSAIAIRRRAQTTLP